MKSRNKKTKLTLLILIICITLGYAALRTSLNINGVASIPNVSWDVYFANYQNSASTNVTPTTEPSTPTGTKPVTISYAVVLSQPGDIYEFTVDVVNGGTIDANINLVSKLDGDEIDSNNPIPDYLTYTITDTNDQPIQTDHRLNHGVTETYKIKLLFKTDVDPEDLPSEGDTLYLDIELTATQAEKESGETGVFTIQIDDVYIGQIIPNTITIYNTPSEATTAFNHPFYLKHILNASDNTVAESYAGFAITDALKTQLKSGCSGNSTCETQVDNLVNGTYYLRGGINESEESTYPIYEANKNVMKTAFNYAAQPTVCTDYSFYFRCGVSGLYTLAQPIGDVHSGVGYDYCAVSEAGQASYCNVTG